MKNFTLHSTSTKAKEFVRNISIYPIVHNLSRRINTLLNIVPTHRRRLGRMLSFSNVIVSPYEYLLNGPNGSSDHQGGPIWPNWHDQLDARHCRNRSPSDDLPNDPGRLHHHITSGAWCGAVVNHFGHQIADFSTRILHTRVDSPKAKLLFAVRQGGPFSKLSECPRFFLEILNWYCVDLNNVEIIHKPTLVHELFVVPQAEQLSNYGPPSEYLDLLDEHVEKRLQRKPKQRGVFVSRAGLEAGKARLAGEGYLENLMNKAGIKVIRPEMISLEAQLTEYEASELLIFSEGSALHSLQLLGRCLDQVYVLNRRRGSRMAENMLNVRSKGLSYGEVSDRLIYSSSLGGTLQSALGISVLNEDAIVEYLRSIDTSLGDRWSHAAYLRARDHDVMAWLQSRAGNKRSVINRSTLDQLRKAGLSHLVSFARTLL